MLSTKAHYRRRHSPSPPACLPAAVFAGSSGAAAPSLPKSRCTSRRCGGVTPQVGAAVVLQCGTSRPYAVGLCCCLVVFALELSAPGQLLLAGCATLFFVLAAYSESFPGCKLHHCHQPLPSTLASSAATFPHTLPVPPILHSRSSPSTLQRCWMFGGPTTTQTRGQLCGCSRSGRRRCGTRTQRR
jgi:hypothetical protein